MFVPRRYSHFVYGVIQSGVATGIATLVATLGSGGMSFVSKWVSIWLTSWALMVPIVIFSAPLIQRLTLFLTFEKSRR
jgi:hypothetical protein